MYILDNINRTALLEDPFSKVVTVFDGSGPSWRKQISGDYKAKRSPVEPEFKIGLKTLQEDVFPARGWLFKIAPAGLEGDDVLAELALQYRDARLETRRGKEQVCVKKRKRRRGGDYCMKPDKDSSRGLKPGYTSVIVSIDKDFLQLLPYGVRIFDPFGRDPDGFSDGPRKGCFTSPESVQAKFGIPASRVADYLSLVGDAADGVSGVPGFGGNAAVAILRCEGVREGVTFEKLMTELVGMDKDAKKKAEPLPLSSSPAAPPTPQFAVVDPIPAAQASAQGSSPALDASPSPAPVTLKHAQAIANLGEAHPVVAQPQTKEREPNFHRDRLRAMDLPGKVINTILKDPYTVLHCALHSYNLVKLPPPRNEMTTDPLKEIATWNIPRECEAARKGKSAKRLREAVRKYTLDLIMPVQDEVEQKALDVADHPLDEILEGQGGSSSGMNPNPPGFGSKPGYSTFRIRPRARREIIRVAIDDVPTAFGRHLVPPFEVRPSRFGIPPVSDFGDLEFQRLYDDHHIKELDRKYEIGGEFSLNQIDPDEGQEYCFRFQWLPARDPDAVEPEEPASSSTSHFDHHQPFWEDHLTALPYMKSIRDAEKRAWRGGKLTQKEKVAEKLTELFGGKKRDDDENDDSTSGGDGGPPNDEVETKPPPVPAQQESSQQSEESSSSSKQQHDSPTDNLSVCVCKDWVTVFRESLPFARIPFSHRQIHKADAYGEFRFGRTKSSDTPVEPPSLSLGTVRDKPDLLFLVPQTGGRFGEQDALTGEGLWRAIREYLGLEHKPPDESPRGFDYLHGTPSVVSVVGKG